jgi:hypothetical protein
MPSPTSAKIVAEAYRYQVDCKGRTIHLHRPAAPTIHVATITPEGEILPQPHIGYTSADHECAMAIRATMSVR